MKHTMIVLALILFSAFCYADKHKSLDKSVPVSSGQRVVIDGFTGSNIDFKSWSKSEVSIKLRVNISSSDNDYEDEYISSANISVDQSNNEVQIRFDAKDRNRDGNIFSKIFGSFYVNKEISGVIYVPQSNPLTTDMRYGSMSLEDMQGELNLLGTTNDLSLKNCSSIKRIDNNYGKTTIENSGGLLKLEGASSTVKINDFKGKVNVDADYSTVTINSVTEGVSLDDRSGTVKVQNVGGDANLNVDYSDVVVGDVKGFVSIKCQSGTVRVNTVDGADINANYSSVELTDVSGKGNKTIKVKGQSGSLKLEDAVGNVVIENPYSTHTLRRIKGNVNISTTSGSIQGEDISGDWNSDTKYSSVKLRKLTAKNVTMTNVSEGIDVRLTNVPDKIDIQNKYGNVKVRMPSGFSGTIDMYAQYGEVETTLPVKMKSRSSSESVSGKVGSGGGSISIETTSGNIEVLEDGKDRD